VRNRLQTAKRDWDELPQRPLPAAISEAAPEVATNRRPRRRSGRVRSGNARRSGHLAQAVARSANRRCACAILSRPSSRWKRCSCFVSQFAMGSKHDLQMTSEIFFAKQIRNPPARVRVLRSISASSEDSLPAILATVHCAKKRTIWTRKMCGAMAFADENASTCRKHIFTGAAGDGLHHFFEYVRGRRRRPGCARNRL